MSCKGWLSDITVLACRYLLVGMSFAFMVWLWAVCTEIFGFDPTPLIPGFLLARYLWRNTEG